MNAPLDPADAAYLTEQREASDARAEEQREIKTVVEWERRMHRVFKGIMPRPGRRAVLRKIGRDIEAGTHGPKVTNDKRPRNRGGGPYVR